MNNVALKSEGTYYRAGAATGALTATDMVADDAEGVEVLSYVDPDGNEDRTKTYVVLTRENKVIVDGTASGDVPGSVEKLK